MSKEDAVKKIREIQAVVRKMRDGYYSDEDYDNLYYAFETIESIVEE